MDAASFQHWQWLFPVAITIHNLEEAIWLPKWSQTAGKWHAGVDAFDFRFAVAVLTALAWVATAWSVWGGPGSIGAYCFGGYVAAMLLNVLLPHLAATVGLRRYAPGLATALLLNAPVCSWLLLAGVRAGWFTGERLAIATAIAVPVLLGSIPVLFRLGRMFRRL